MPAIPKPYPFAQVRPQRTARFYALWALQLALSPIILPLRVLLLGLCLLAWYAALRLATIGLDLSRPVPLSRRRITRRVSMVFGRIFMFAAGHVVIREHGERPDYETEAAVVSNHVASLDGVLLTSLGFPSFIAKDQVRHMPFFGIFAAANQSLFVRREDRGDRKSALANIVERMSSSAAAKRGLAGSEGRGGKGEGEKHIGQPGPAASPKHAADLSADSHADARSLYPPISIFPEGTVTNGTCVLPFKIGAFAAGAPVCPVAIVYDKRLADTSDACVGMIRTVARSMLCLNTTVDVYYLPRHAPTPEERGDAALFAENVREEVAQCLGVPLAEMSLKDKYYFVGQLRDASECSEACRSEFAEYVGARKWWVNAPAKEKAA